MLISLAVAPKAVKNSLSRRLLPGISIPLIQVIAWDKALLEETQTLTLTLTLTLIGGLLEETQRQSEQGAKKGSMCRHFGLTLLIVGLAMTLAMFLPNIQVVFSLLGSTTSAFVCYIVPAMFVIKVEEGPWYSRKKLPAACLMVGGAITGVVCTGVIVFTTFIQPASA